MKIIRQPLIDPPIERIDIRNYLGGDEDSHEFNVSLTPHTKDKGVGIKIGAYYFSFTVGKADELSEALKLLVDQIEDEFA